MTSSELAATDDLRGFRERHPWPEDLLGAGLPLETLWTFDLKVDRARLWPIIADTSRMNRALGVSQMHFEERDGVMHGSARNAGMLQTWIEVPWTWIAERQMESVRKYTRGFAHCVRGIFELEEIADGTRLRVYFGWIPRGFWQRWLLKLGMAQIERDYRRVLAELEQQLASEKPLSLLTTMSGDLAEDAESRLAKARQAMLEGGIDEALADRVLEHVRDGDPMDLYRIQVLALARQWVVDEDELLRALLRATKAGILSLSWDVICPHCRGVREEVSNLGDVPETSECEVCEIDFDTDTENSVEITFHVHPAVRDVPKLYFCSAEPSTKLHIKAQVRVDAGEHLEVPTCLRPGRYRIRHVGGAAFKLFDVREDAAAKRLPYIIEPGADESPDSTAPRSVRARDVMRVGPDAELHIVNDSDNATTVVVEDSKWADSALRPGRLFSFQDFRDLFGDESLGADVQISVGEQTILFTDVIGSTALYEARGDPGAFLAVKKHFTKVFEAVRSFDGAVVKTIGDATMAAFREPVDALRAAKGIHERLPPGEEGVDLRVRVSLNSGPCLAVKLNSNIDYFGSTVNVAAKLQACAEAGEIAFSAKLLEDEAVRRYLTDEDVHLDALTLSHRALPDPLPVRRWNINGEPRSRA